MKKQIISCSLVTLTILSSLQSNAASFYDTAMKTSPKQVESVLNGKTFSGQKFNGYDSDFDSDSNSFGIMTAEDAPFFGYVICPASFEESVICYDQNSTPVDPEGNPLPYDSNGNVIPYQRPPVASAVPEFEPISFAGFQLVRAGTKLYNILSEKMSKVTLTLNDFLVKAKKKQ